MFSVPWLLFEVRLPQRTRLQQLWNRDLTDGYGLWTVLLAELCPTNPGNHNEAPSRYVYSV